ncbi:MAG: porin family protein [Gammaproteobacteria bacterium]|nr:porin family protein [Gammaproteobacteria bacterium]
MHRNEYHAAILFAIGSICSFSVHSMSVMNCAAPRINCAEFRGKPGQWMPEPDFTPEKRPRSPKPIPPPPPKPAPPPAPLFSALHQTNPWAKVISFNIGPVTSAPGRTQTMLLQPGVLKTYADTSKDSLFSMGEIFVGGQHAVSSLVSGQIGLAVGAGGNAKATGDIWEDANPDFNNFTYGYKINHAQVTIKGKLLTEFKGVFQPYVSAGFGLSFNRAFDFTISPDIYEEVAPPPFHDDVTTTYTYSLGVGMQKQLRPNIYFGIGYEFADWGVANLGAATGQTLNGGLQLNHVYTNELLFSINYIK